VIGTVVQEDISRSIRSSSPFNGYASGVHPLTGIPDGRPLKNLAKKADSGASASAAASATTAEMSVGVGGDVGSDPPWPKGADIHGPYQHGGMFPAVNGGGKVLFVPVSRLQV
jgi:hypothetical protein